MVLWIKQLLYQLLLVLALAVELLLKVFHAVNLLRDVVETGFDIGACLRQVLFGHDGPHQFEYGGTILLHKVKFLQHHFIFTLLLGETPLALHDLLVLLLDLLNLFGFRLHLLLKCDNLLG